MIIYFSVFIPEQSLRRIDLYIESIYPDISRSYINRLISNGHIRVNNKILGKDRRVKLKDKISIEFISEPYYLQGENIPLEIIADTPDFAIISKDAGMNTHTFPGEYGKSGTLLNALLYYFGDQSVIDGIERPGIIHRLDRDTSGLIIIAKNDRSMRALQKKIAHREIRKIYYAIVNWVVWEKEWFIESYIGEDASDHKKMTTKNPVNPKLAQTKFTLLKHIDTTYSLLEIELFTGRTHQIRVHMADMGHPIIGDKTYGNHEVNNEATIKYGLSRQWLHARKLAFELFWIQYEFTAPLKKDITKILNAHHIELL
jgi:23S rRNA pseudouridine1911/1915/1917 synthase